MIFVDKLITTKAPSQALLDSIRQLGVIRPVTLRRKDFKVIDGHKRIAACKILGIKEVTAVFGELTDEEIVELGAFNRAAIEFICYKHMLLRLCKQSPEMTLKELAVLIEPL